MLAWILAPFRRAHRDDIPLAEQAAQIAREHQSLERRLMQARERHRGATARMVAAESPQEAS